MPEDRRCGDDRGEVVDRSSGPQAEGVGREAERVTDAREGEDRSHVEGEDGGDGIGDVGIRGGDHRIGGDDGRCSADAGPHADQRPQVPGHPQCPSDHDGSEQRHRQRAEENRQRRTPDGEHLVEREPGAQDHDRRLQDRLGSEVQSRTRPFRRRADECDADPPDDGEHRGSDYGGQVAEKRGQGGESHDRHQPGQECRCSPQPGSARGGLHFRWCTRGTSRVPYVHVTTFCPVDSSR